MANYYDKVLEDFESEGIFDEGIFDEGAFDEAIFNRRRPSRGGGIPSSVRRPSNFGQHVTPGHGGNQQSHYATKAELKSSLNSISEQVNDLKKSNISIAASIKDLNEGYEKVIKSIAKKDKAQDSVATNSAVMSLLGTIINKPALNTDALQIVDKDGKTVDTAHKIAIAPNQDPLQVDLTKTLMFTLMPTMMSGNSGSGNNGMMMLMPLMLLLGKPAGASGSAGGTDSTLVLAMMMMMMMNKN